MVPDWNTETANEYGHQKGEQAAAVALSTVRDWAQYALEWKDRWEELENVPTEALNELIETEAYLSEVHARQFASFSAGFSSEVNKMPEEQAEEIWESYEAGVKEGIESDRKYRLQQLREKFGEED